MRYGFLRWLGIFFLVGCGSATAPTAVAPTTTVSAAMAVVPTPPPGALLIEPEQTLGAISPAVYGTNYGPWVVVPFELQAQANSAGLHYLRFPGGNWGDLNNITHRQLDQFVTLARAMGAEPSISVRLRGGTVEAAVDLLTYANITQKYAIRYWSIGNEPSLYKEYDTERYNTEWRAFATAMKAVDPTILLIGPDTHQFTGETSVNGVPAVNPTDSNGRPWLRAFLEENGDLVDIVAIHRYPFPVSLTSTTSIAELRANSREWDTIIPNLRALIQETTGRDLPVAVTEINSHWTKAVGGEATPDSFYNAIWWGDVLGRMIQQDVDMVGHFVLQTKDSAGGWGLLSRDGVRPTYYVYQMYKHFGTQRLAATSDDPLVSVYAARRTNGALTVMVINLGATAVTKPLYWHNNTPTAQAHVWLFDADHPASKLADQTLTNGGDIQLPSQSMTLFIIP